MSKITTNAKNKLEYKTAGSVGMDLCASDNYIIQAGKFAMVSTGTFVDLDDNHFADVRGRSGLASKGIFAHYGTIDSDYHGEIKIILYNLSEVDFAINPGDRIAQIVLFDKAEQFKVIPFFEYDPIESERGVGGFGSTGTN